MAKKGKQECGNCWFARGDGDQNKLSCHRHAPLPYSFYQFYIGELLRDTAWSSRITANVRLPKEGDVADEVGVDATEDIGTELTGWPGVERDQWCGEWKRRITPVVEE